MTKQEQAVPHKIKMTKQELAMPHEIIKAKESKDYSKRNLPHFESHGKPLYITFCTHERWILPEKVRGKVLEHCLFDNGKKINLLAAIVMPDHVHLIYEPLFDHEGKPFSLTEVLSGIKGASAHSVNRMLGRKGHVWQDERFDHVVRTSESVDGKVEYVRMNPVRKGLCASPENYPWFWIEERFLSVAQPPSAVTFSRDPSTAAQPGAAVPHKTAAAEPPA